MSRLAVAPGLSVKHVGPDVFILNRKTSQVFTFNGTGAFIWKRVETESTRETILRELTETFEVSPEQAESDLDMMLSTMSQNGLLASPQEKSGALQRSAADVS